MYLDERDIDRHERHVARKLVIERNRRRQFACPDTGVDLWLTDCSLDRITLTSTSHS